VRDEPSSHRRPGLIAVDLKLDAEPLQQRDLLSHP
jgi:hypothetical protein